MESEPQSLYSQNNKLQVAAAKKVLDEFLPKSQRTFGPQDKILDIGCGDGEVTKKTVLEGFPDVSRVVACDALQEIVEHAKKINSADRLSYEVLDFGREDARVLVEKYGEFAGICSFNCLHWIRDMEQVFRNMFNVLQHGGECFLYFMQQSELMDASSRIVKKDAWKEYFQSPNDLIYYIPKNPLIYFVQLATKTGFDVNLTEKVHRCYHFKAKKEMIDLLMGLTMFINIPVEKRDAFVEDWLSEIPVKQIDENTWEMKFKMMKLHLIKE